MSNPLPRKAELPGSPVDHADASERGSPSLGDFLSELMSDPNPPSPTNAWEPGQQSRLDELAEHIAQSEQQAATAISHIEKSVQSLADRLESSDRDRRNTDLEVTQALDDLRQTHAVLSEQIAHLGKQAAGPSQDRIDALENALKAHEVSLQQVRSDAERRYASTVGRLETIERDAPDIDALNGRLSVTEQSVDQQFQTMEQNVVAALTAMRSSISTAQGRLSQAETRTDQALVKLERAFDSLDAKVSRIAANAGPDEGRALLDTFNERFDQLNEDVHAQVAAAREEFAAGIEQVAVSHSTADIRRLEDAIDTLSRRYDDTQHRQNEAVESMGQQFARVAEGLDARLDTLERDPGAHGLQGIIDKIEARLNGIDERDTNLFQSVGNEINQLAERLDQRVQQSEQRSAEAIEQVGEQVASVAGRLQARQDQALGQFTEELAKGQAETNKHFETGLSRLTERLDSIEEQSASAMSPVQRAIASLARRLEAIEDQKANTPAPASEPVAQAIIPASSQTEATEPAIEIAPEPTPVSAPSASTQEPAPAAPESQFQPLAMTELPSEETALDDAHAPLPDFEAGFEDWSDLDDDPVPTAEPFPSEAAADHSRFSSVDAPPVPEDMDGFIRDPLSEIDDSDTQGAEEVRDSDIFDEEPVALPEEAGDQPTETADDAAETLDYIARARRAALQASANSDAITPNKSKRSAKKRNTADVSPRRGPNKLTLITVSTAAILAAGSIGYLSLRGASKSDDFALRPPSTPTPAEPVDVSDDAQALSSSQAEQNGSEASTALPASDPRDDEDISLASLTEIVPSTEPAPTEAFDEPAIDDTPLAIIPAFPTLEQSAARGNQAAAFQLGLSALEAGDIARGADLVRSAAEAGLPAGQYRLAKLHEKGTGVPRDFAEARRWSQAAAEGGNVKAMHDYAAYLTSGDGGQQNYAEAIEWFRRAAEYGVVDSQFNLGQMYERGLGVTADVEEALFWMEVARASGDESTLPIIRSLRARLPETTASDVTARALSWRASSPDGPANGIFPPSATNSAYRQQVSAVQAALNRFGYEAGPADGVMGAQTRQAIVAYQRDQRIAPTGAIDAALIERMNQAIQAF